MIYGIIDLLIKRLEKIYLIYEKYVWKNENAKIQVWFHNNEISFYLYDDGIIDEFTVTFKTNETDLYICMSLMLFAYLYGNIEFHNVGNIYYTNGYKNYLRIVIADWQLNDFISSSFNNYDGIINYDNLIISAAKKTVHKKVYTNKFINQLDMRINYTKKLLDIGEVI